MPVTSKRRQWRWRHVSYVVSCWASLALVVGCERARGPELTFNPGNASELRKLLQAGKTGGDSSTAVAAAEPTGWATLKGKFTINGSPPSLPPLNANKDMEVCAPGGKQPADESVVIGPGNGIKNLLVFLTTTVPADNPKWEHESFNAAKTGEVLFDQKNCVFLSHVFAMRSTQTMKVLNSDPVGHNTNLDSKRGSASANFTVAANTTSPANAPSYEPKQPSPAPFGVSCSIHPWMKAWLMVCNHPYFAVTKEDGSFEIANLPAGVPLDFRVWQERATSLQDVTVDGAATKWNKGKFSLTLADGESKELNVVVDSSLLK